MEDIINRLTENGNYANEIVLLFIVNNDEVYLEYLDKIDIRGRDLEIFAYDCCHECDPEYIKDTLLCISFGLFDLDVIYDNLKSKNPLAIIDKLHIPTDTPVRRYIRLKNEFDNKFINNKSR